MLIVVVCCHSQAELDEVAAARDIAEFEKNIHLSQPCTTLDGFNVSGELSQETLTVSWQERDVGQDHDQQLGLVKRSRGQGTGELTSLQVVGLSMKPLEVGSDEAPSRPLSRASRAESMGSLADFSVQTLQIQPADYQYRSRQVSCPGDNTQF